jgi:hypothetical protein
MRKIFTIMLFLSVAPLWASSDIHQLTEFDGSKPIIGIFDEALPASFFTQDFSAAFTNKYNYTTFYDFYNQIHGKTADSGFPNIADDFSNQAHDKTIAYLINETDLNNDIVISAMDINARTVKNFMIRVSAFDEIALDISPLQHYDHVFMMSLSKFEVQINAPLARGKMANFNLEVQAPTLFGGEVNDQKACSNFKSKVQFSNRAPATPGVIVAWAELATRDFATPIFRIEYPLNSGVWFHEPAGPYYNCVTTYVTEHFTYASQSTRYIRWTYLVQMFGLNSWAKGECLTPTSGSNSCFVAGTSTLASWEMRMAYD